MLIIESVLRNCSLIYFAAAEDSDAFSVTIAESSLLLGLGEVVPFSEAHINVGGHVNMLTHSYTCPLDAIYEFRLHVHTEQQRSARLAIDVNGVIVAEVFAQDDDFEATAATSVIQACTAGMMVKVLGYQPLSEVQGRGFFVFSGKLLTTNAGIIK